MPGVRPFGVDEHPAEHAPEPQLERVHLGEMLAERGDQLSRQVGTSRVTVFRGIEGERAVVKGNVPVLEGLYLCLEKSRRTSRPKDRI